MFDAVLAWPGAALLTSSSRSQQLLIIPSARLSTLHDYQFVSIFAKVESINSFLDTQIPLSHNLLPRITAISPAGNIALRRAADIHN